MSCKPKHISLLMSVVILISVFLGALFPTVTYGAPKSGAAESTEALEANAEARKDLPIQSNETTGWPAGPEIGAEAAILMDVDTGTILYAKNINEELYPASTTKLMTCLIAYEEGRMSDMVSFSREAVFSVPADGSNMGMDAGEAITLEQCLYGILVGSANEVANAVAEHISGSIDGFVELMNKRAAEMGCTNTHFTNTNGLQNEAHYTSAEDLAIIAREFFANDALARIANTARYHFEPTDTQPDDFYLRNKHSLINGEIEYEGIRGGKTGYTNDARQTLVTCCEQNRMRLVCVVLMEESPAQFYDTVTLFDYGFSNFSLVRVAEYETRYTISVENFLKTGSDIFGSSQPFLSLNEDSRIILPANVSFEDLSTEISYTAQDAVAQIYYSYNGAGLGSALVETINASRPEYEFEHVTPEEGNDAAGISIDLVGGDRIIFVNVKMVLFGLLGGGILIILIITAIKITRDCHFSGKAEDKRRRRINRRRTGRKKYRGEFSDYDF